MKSPYKFSRKYFSNSRIKNIFLNVRNNRIPKIQNYIRKNNIVNMILAVTKMNLINECLLLMNLLMNSIKRNKLKYLFTQLKPVKRKSRDISNKKDADATKSKRFKKGATIGKPKHELKILVTDFREKKLWIYYIFWLFSFSRGIFGIS